MTEYIVEYVAYVKRKVAFGLLLFLILILAIIYSLCVGDYTLPVGLVLKTLFGAGTAKSNLVIWQIRLPRILAAVIVGAGLSVAGAVMQCVLRNPLASPYTIGISHGAMFGAALAIILFGLGGAESSGKIFVNNPYGVTLFAFLGSLISVAVILTLAKFRGLSPEAMILAGVAMSSLFIAGTMLIQYFANELQLAAIIYWTFGDLSRPLWKENFVMLSIGLPAFLYFLYKRWDYNALESGEDIAKSLGVDTERTRLYGMLVASLVTSVYVALVGMIGFVGLICPHITRLVIGGDYRYLIPISALSGAVLLLISDTIARTMIAPISLPVGIITSFMGAPVFIYLLVKLQKRW